MPQLLVLLPRFALHGACPVLQLTSICVLYPQTYLHLPLPSVMQPLDLNFNAFEAGIYFFTIILAVVTLSVGQTSFGQFLAVLCSLDRFGSQYLPFIGK